ncbi:HNH endonuclease [Haloterrigena salinisoli]|uniref:HNH endonuclease n=1 Tax=Haloterrigena salinisoli TaxID=3132747 RepID=UPI0030CD2EE5
MSSQWDLSDILDEDQETDTSPVEFDAPASRSSDWKNRATEIKERDNYVCQRCGDHNGNHEQSPLSLETHHIVPGKYLPKSDARVGLNLVTVCESCHGFLEGSHVEWQLAEIGRDDALQILTVLKERRLTPHHLSRKLDISEDRIRSLVSLLERMNCLTTQGDGRYRTVCPATSKSRVRKARFRWKQKHAVRQPLEEMLTELQRTMTTSLDELEYALEAGDRDQVESMLERMRNTITEADFEEAVSTNDDR